jgi:hypothetical protein
VLRAYGVLAAGSLRRSAPAILASIATDLGFLWLLRAGTLPVVPSAERLARVPAWVPFAYAGGATAPSPGAAERTSEALAPTSALDVRLTLAWAREGDPEGSASLIAGVDPGAACRSALVPGIGSVSVASSRLDPGSASVAEGSARLVRGSGGPSARRRRARRPRRGPGREISARGGVSHFAERLREARQDASSTVLTACA